MWILRDIWKKSMLFRYVYLKNTILVIMVIITAAESIAICSSEPVL